MKNILRIFTVLVIFAFSGISFGVSAEHYSIEDYEIPVDIIINGNIIKTPVCAFLENDVTYAPVRAISEAVGASVTWDDSTKTASVSFNETVLSFVSGTDALNYRDTLFVPIRRISEGFGFDVSFDGYYYQVNINAPGVVIPHEKIDYSYSNSDILLIAQVLFCEARRNSFEGQIAVANVIINRVSSNLFPDTVREVIYDRRYGSVQFGIAYNGMIDNTPEKVNILAAKCALSGAIVAKDCLFYQADYVTNSWTNKNRTYAMSVGGNAFFY